MRHERGGFLQLAQFNYKLIAIGVRDKSHRIASASLADRRNINCRRTIPAHHILSVLPVARPAANPACIESRSPRAIRLLDHDKSH